MRFVTQMVLWAAVYFLLVLAFPELSVGRMAALLLALVLASASAAD